MPSYYAHADAVVRRYGPTCHLCGRGIDLTIRNGGGALQLDHVWPRSLGGCDHADNLRPSHRTCNASRGNRILPSARHPVCPCAVRYSAAPATPVPFGGGRTTLARLMLPTRRWAPDVLWWLTGSPVVILSVLLLYWFVKATVVVLVLVGRRWAARRARVMAGATVSVHYSQSPGT